VAAKCTPCVGKDLKDLLATLQDPEIDKILAKVPDCPDPREIQMCIIKRRANRSAYNVFISNCLRGHQIKSFGEAPEAMRKCAKQWKDQQGKL